MSFGPGSGFNVPGCTPINTSSETGKALYTYQDMFLLRNLPPRDGFHAIVYVPDEILRAIEWLLKEKKQ